MKVPTSPPNVEQPRIQPPLSDNPDLELKEEQPPPLQDLGPEPSMPITAASAAAPEYVESQPDLSHTTHDGYYETQPNFSLDAALAGLVDGTVDDGSGRGILVESPYAESGNLHTDTDFDSLVDSMVPNSLQNVLPTLTDVISGDDDTANSENQPIPALSGMADQFAGVLDSARVMKDALNPPLDSPRPHVDSLPPFSDFNSPQSLGSANSFTTAFDGMHGFGAQAASLIEESPDSRKVSPARSDSDFDPDPDAIDDVKPRSLHLDVEALAKAVPTTDTPSPSQLTAATALTENSIVSSLGALPALPSPLATATDFLDDMQKSAQVLRNPVSVARGAVEQVRAADDTLDRLRVITDLAQKHVDTVFALGTLTSFIWGIALAIAAAFSGHFGLAAAQSASAGGGAYVLQRRKVGVANVLERARSIFAVADDPDKITNKLSGLLHATLTQVVDTAATLVGTVTAPVVLTIPAVVLAFIGVNGFWTGLGVQAAVVLFIAPFFAALVAFYSRIRDWAVSKCERVVRPHIDTVVDRIHESTPLLQT